MRGVILVALIFFSLGFVAAGGLPAMAQERLAAGGTPVDSTSRISFDNINVYPNQVIIQEPGITYAKVASNSMAPIITDKSTVFEKAPVLDEIKVGDVISFYEPTVNDIVLHMVVEIKNENGKTSYITKGTANKEIDNWVVPFENVKGVMVGTFR